MNKILSVVVILLAMVWTWTKFHSDSGPISIETHAGLQSKLTLFIEESLKKQKPELMNFRLLKISTEKVDDQKIKAHFAYEFSDGNGESKAQQTVEGDAVLIKSLSENKQISKWEIQNLVSNHTAVQFSQETIVTDSTVSSAPEEKSENNEVQTAAPENTQPAATSSSAQPSTESVKK